MLILPFMIYPSPASLASPTSHPHLQTALFKFCINPQPHHILPLDLTCSAKTNLSHFCGGSTPICLSRFRVPFFMGLVPTVQVRLAHQPLFLMRLFPGLEGQTYHSGLCMAGDSSRPPIKPQSLGHLHPCLEPYQEWKRYSVHVCWARLLSPANVALNIEVPWYTWGSHITYLFPEWHWA